MLTIDVPLIKIQLSDVLEGLRSNPRAPPSSHTTTAAQPVAATKPSYFAGVYKVGMLQFSLPPPISKAVYGVLSTRHAYGEMAISTY